MKGFPVVRRRLVAIVVGVGLMLGAGLPAAAAADPHRADHRPDAPTELTTSPCFQRCDSPALISSTSSQLRALVTDPDGGNLAKVTIEVWNADGTELVADSGEALTTIRSGSQVVWTPPLPDLSGETYRWRARACDTAGCGTWSSWFVFSVDTVDPATPTISSTDYPEADRTGTGAGGVGVPGVFHLGANGSADVAQIRWSLDMSQPLTVAVPGPDGIADITVVPGLDGPNTLFAQSVDIAGNRSEITSYEFLVKPPPDSVGVWSFDEGAGSVAGDSSGAGNDAALHGGITWVPGHVGAAAIALDGSTGYLGAGSGLVDTTRSFTVAGWAYRAASDRDQAMVSQSGDADSAFTLGYLAACDCWAFRVRDGSTGESVSVQAADAAPESQWVHLAAVYDALNQQVRLYVNGYLASSVTVATPIASAGPFEIGRAGPGEYWSGDLDDTGAYPRALTGYEIQMLAFAADG